jgi:integrase/recombinase XerD
MLSRQAMNCTASTMAFYRYTAGKFLEWIEQRDVTAPHEVTARHVREYIAELIGRGRKDTTAWDHARAIKTMLHFWHVEGYTPTLVKFDLPKLAAKRLPVLTVEQLREIVKVCSIRDKAIVLLMVDSGLRRAEVCNLNWNDVDMQTGLVRVRQGKGRKDRSAVIGAKTRRALLAYRRTLQDHGPMFQAKNGERLAGLGVLAIFRRLTKQTGIHVTPHSLRRTFVILSLRNGMDVLHLQAMLGHSSLDMVYHYAQMVDDDLLQAHKAHSPIDNL